MTTNKAQDQSYPMNGGDGTFSYTKNSYIQEAAVNAAKTTIHEAIEDKLDINELFFSNKSTNNGAIFRMADLGCSVGPNTFSSMGEILEVVKHKYLKFSTSPKTTLEFQVFFNDHVTDDFNTLFASLPIDKPYFAVGVPGSFHGHLFPNSSLHLVHSSYALLWLSQLPKELVDESSTAFNRGRIHYLNASNDVFKAYGAQFAKDMAMFLDARAKELVVGGLMVLTMPFAPNGVTFSRVLMCVVFHLLGSSLMDMAKEGLVNEDQVNSFNNSFNIPVYLVSQNEMKELIEVNGCFSIEKMELTKSMFDQSQIISTQTTTMHLRAAVEVLLTKHFGSEIIDELFDRFHKKIEKISDQLQHIHKEGGFQIILVLKRK
ncbi:hypothetical protein CsatA_026746 [Cannabis sativa]